MSESTFWLSAPRGPFTLTVLSGAISTVTPAGKITGNLPILDIFLRFKN
jgi:hypothetical protein